MMMNTIYTTDELRQLADVIGGHCGRGLNFAATRIAALEAEVARYRHLGIQYLGWLDVKNTEDGIEKDMCNPTMFEGSNLSARSQP